MPPIDQSNVMAPQDRRLEIARLLAIGLLRFRSRPAPVVVSDPSSPTTILPDSSKSCLEVPAKTVLSVHTG